MGSYNQGFFNHAFHNQGSYKEGFLQQESENQRIFATRGSYIQGS